MRSIAVARGGAFLIASSIHFASGTANAATPPNVITYNGKPYYLNGINVAWNQFGTRRWRRPFDSI